MCRAERCLYLACYTARRKAAVEGLTRDRVDFGLDAAASDAPRRGKTMKRFGVAHTHPKLRAALWNEPVQSASLRTRRGSSAPTYRIIRGISMRRSASCLSVPDSRTSLPTSSSALASPNILRRGVQGCDVVGVTKTSPATSMRVPGERVPEARQAFTTELA